jgi:large subunit ribosomal protein L18
MKSKVRNESQRKWQSRRQRVRKKVAQSTRTQLTVFRSAKHIYAQLVDPSTGNTLATVSTRNKGIGAESGGNIDAAKKVGTAIAAAAKDKNIDSVVFNRNGFLYHGRVKALAEAAREAGLQF